MIPLTNEELTAETLACLRLASVEGLGPVRARMLIEGRGSAVAALRTPPRDLAPYRVSGPMLRAARQAHLAPALERAAQVGARPVGLSDPSYPELLRTLHDPPTVLWQRGHILPRDAFCVAVVGSRRASDYGRQIAYEAGRALAAAGIVVVSGLAFGVDAAAHEGALESTGATAGVLASGIDRITPAGNRRLASRLLVRGTVLTEQPPGASAAPGLFPRRNRIISGICTAVLVVEAAARSGALITARTALEQGRDVWAVPGPVTRAQSQGTNALIGEGAARLYDGPASLLESVVGVLPDSSRASEAADVVERAVGREPTPLDVICRRSGLPTAEVLARLTRLELDGRVRSVHLNHYLRASA